MKTGVSFIFTLALSLFLIGGLLGGSLAGSTLALAKGKPFPEVKGPPDVHGEDDEGGNNLSIPAIYIGTGGPEPQSEGFKMPTGTSVSSYEGQFFDGLYYLQGLGLSEWCAKYDNLITEDQPIAQLKPEWGDNLVNAPRITTGKPIRVEMVLYYISGDIKGTKDWQGFQVKNLTTYLPDSEALYGTNGAVTTADNPLNFVDMRTRVWVDGAKLTITKDGETTPVHEDYMSAEINSIGGIVYGYNWGLGDVVPAGDYDLTFTIDSSKFPGVKMVFPNPDGVGTYENYSTTLSIKVDPAPGDEAGGNGNANQNGKIH